MTDRQGYARAVHDVESLAPAQPPLEYTFACQPVAEEVFLDVLGRVTTTLDEWGRPWALLGGLAAAVHGRPRWTYDIDVFVQPYDGRPALGALGAAGFATDEKDPYWLFKAMDRGVLVDIIFKATAGIYFDEEMIERVRRVEFHGVSVPVLSAEDMVVIKATAFAEHTARHWWDALAILARTDLDWSYLVRRARNSPRRVASLLLFARSVDLVVPDEAVHGLLERLEA